MAKKAVRPEAAEQAEGSFEELLDATEAIVGALEDGGLGLEESLKLYEKGVQNLGRCAKLLDTAEEKVKILVEKTKDAFEMADFEVDEEDGGELER